MSTPSSRSPSFLDPSEPSGWDRALAVGHRMLEDVVHRLRTIEERPVWRPLPDALRSAIRAPMRDEPADLGDVYDLVRDAVLEYGPGGPHPRFWGWVTGTGTLTGVYAEMLAASVNGPAGLFNDVTGEVERAVLEWCKHVTGMPAESSGTLTSGGSIANLVGLQVARDARFPGVRERGMHTLERAPRVYASDEVHSSVHKAVAALGLGWNALQLVPADDALRLPLDGLAAAVRRDRDAGLAPMAVVASAGTVSTGAVDPLHEIADFCEREGLWLHVDGAIGALARMAPSAASILDGISRADSLAFDFHKWLYVPYEAGCVLVRDETLHRASFSVPAPYLTAIPRGLGGPSLRSGDLGPQLSRGFKALKVWMSLREAGVARYREAIERNMLLARSLEQKVVAAPGLELGARSDLSIVCFRYRPEGLSPQALDRLNTELLMALQESGLAVVSHTVLHDRFMLRCAITNHRTTEADLDLLIAELLALGPRLMSAQVAR